MNMNYYIYSLGCKVNSYESEATSIDLSSSGYKRVSNCDDAEIIIVNTCSVTSRADGKSRQKISSFRKSNPNAIIVVMGCYSQTHGQVCLDLGADIVIGTSRRSMIKSYIEQYKETHEKIIDLSKSVRHEQYEELGAIAFCENARAYLKIQDGCDNFCSYCFIPTLRGNSRSREPRDVINEAMRLVDAGYMEIVITGIHIGAYGKDLGDGSYRFSDLLRSILSKCPNLYRLRISSIEASEIDDVFLALLRDYPNIARHMHIPLQSGSKDVLKDMKRHYDTDAFLAKLDAIRAVDPNIAITTDVIVGYPTESDAQFEETLEFCKKAQFAQIHVFPFSPRPGTFAATLQDIHPEIKKARVGKLLALSDALWHEYQQRFIGQEVEILLEDKDPKTKKWRGHSSNYLLIEVEGDDHTHGEILKTRYKI